VGPLDTALALRGGRLRGWREVCAKGETHRFNQIKPSITYEM